jgi:hypothetical protein
LDHQVQEAIRLAQEQDLEARCLEAQREQELELRRLEAQRIREEEGLRPMQEMTAQRMRRDNTILITKNLARHYFANPIYPSDSDSLGDYNEE